MMKTIGNTRNKTAVILPMVLILVLLLAISITVLTSFSSGNRALIIRSEKKLYCHLAAVSAILEARTKVNEELRKGIDSWPELWRDLLPPETKLPSVNVSIHPGTTAQNFQPNIFVSNVEIKPLIKQIHKGRFQGLLSFSVTAESSISTFDTISISRQENIRFIVSRHLPKGLSITLLPGSDSILEKAN